jgi:hypothetical protein
LVFCLPACLGTGKGTGAPGEGAVFSADAGSATDAGMDVVQQDADPHPGGVSAPLNEWEGESTFITVVRGDVSQCAETVHLANGTDKKVVRSRLNGRIVRVDAQDGTESPALLCSLRYVRVMEGQGDSLQCTDIVLGPDCTFEKEMEIADPGSVAFHQSKSIVNLMKPQPKPACGSALDSEFLALKSEFDFTGLITENPPACPQEAQEGQQRATIKPSRSIILQDKFKGVLE